MKSCSTYHRLSVQSIARNCNFCRGYSLMLKFRSLAEENDDYKQLFSVSPKITATLRSQSAEAPWFTKPRHSGPSCSFAQFQDQHSTWDSWFTRLFSIAHIRSPCSFTLISLYFPTTRDWLGSQELDTCLPQSIIIILQRWVYCWVIGSSTVGPETCHERQHWKGCERVDRLMHISHREWRLILAS
jgi:hypothetical protein